MVRKAAEVSKEAFAEYLKKTFAETISKNESVAKLRLHLFDEIDNTRPDAPGVIHNEPNEQQYQAAFEIAFLNHLEREKFFQSSEYSEAVKDMSRYVQGIYPFPEKYTDTFVYGGKMTLAGQRGALVAKLIKQVGAINQLQPEIESLMLYGYGTNP
jgi:hypothetical protein